MKRTHDSNQCFDASNQDRNSRIIPASDPNGRFAGSSNLRLLGLLGLFVCKDFFGFSSLQDFLGFSSLQDFLGFSSLRTSWAFRLLGLLGLFVS